MAMARFFASAFGGSGADRRPLRPVLLYRRLMFGRQTRADVWQLLADILDSGAQISPTLGAMAAAYRAQGKHAVADVILELRAAIPRLEFTQVVARYAGTGETIVMDGFGRQDAARIAAGAARLVRMEIALRRAIWGAVALPLLLILGLIGLVFLFGLNLFPALEDVVDFETLPVFHQWLAWAVVGFAGNPLLPALTLAAPAAVIAWALPNWSGPGRATADRFPPFSLARLQAGAGFLFAVIEYGRAGEGITTRLFRRMAGTARPYAASRIRAIEANYVAGGNNLGAASRLAGQGFPSPELGPILEMLWNREDGITRAGVFTDRWLDRVEITVRARMAMVNAVLLALIAAALVVLISIALPITEELNKGLFL